MRRVESVATFFPEKKEEKNSEKIWLKISQFVENHPVEFSETEENKLMSDYEELGKQGLKGVLHVINQGSPTGNLVTREIPEAFKEKYYHRLHLINTEKAKEQSRSIQEGDEVVYISKAGEIDQENKDKIEKVFKDRVGIIVGGGAGSPKDSIYKPLLIQLEKVLKSKTAGAGICLGHQMFGELFFKLQRELSEGVTPGYIEATSSVEKITREGSKNPVFGRFGKRITVASLNEYHLVMPELNKDTLSYGKVLTRSEATDYPTSLSLDSEASGQIITTQRHPEIGMAGTRSQFLQKDEIFQLPSGRDLIVPAGGHPDLLIFANYLKGEAKYLYGRYGITEGDIQNMFVAEKLKTHLGKDFYGPLLSYMAKFRFKNS